MGTKGPSAVNWYWSERTTRDWHNCEVLRQKNEYSRRKWPICHDLSDLISLEKTGVMYEMLWNATNILKYILNCYINIMRKIIINITFLQVY